MGRADRLLAGPVRGPRRHAACRRRWGRCTRRRTARSTRCTASKRTKDDDEEPRRRRRQGRQRWRPKMGPGKPGEIRVGPNGKRYRWVLGVGPGGKRTGFWRRLRPGGAAAPGGAAGPARAEPRRPGAPAARASWGWRTATASSRPEEEEALPEAAAAVRESRHVLIPIPGTGPLVRCRPHGRRQAADQEAGRRRGRRPGRLVQASDGSLYQVQGFDEDELRGLYDDDRIEGLAADDDLRGFAADDQLVGVDEFGDMRVRPTRTSTAWSRRGARRLCARRPAARDAGLRAGEGTPRRGCSSATARFPRIGSLCGKARLEDVRSDDHAIDVWRRPGCAGCSHAGGPAVRGPVGGEGDSLRPRRDVSRCSGSAAIACRT